MKPDNRFVFLVVLGIMVMLTGLPDFLCAEENPDVQNRITIVIKETNLVKTPHIYLGDISDIHANGFIKETLEKMDLGPSPKPDKIKFFSRKKIVSMIQGQRYLPKNIIITAPQRIYVKQQSQIISKQDVRRFVDLSLLSIFKNKAYSLTAFSVRGLEPYPQGNIHFAADVNDMVGKTGKLSFFIDILIDGKKEDRVSVSGQVAVYETVLHTRRSCNKGEALARENVYQEKKNIFEMAEDFIKTWDEIDGKILKSNVNKGDYLKASSLSDPPLIQKGDIITLVAKNENLLIVTTGISKEDGFENELIKVENLNSGKLVQGIVKEKTKVEVVY